MKTAVSETSCIRFLHALPGILDLDIYMDEKLFAKDQLYEDFTRYKTCSAREHTITLRKYHEKEDFYTQKITLKPASVSTLLITCMPSADSSIQILLLNEPYKKIPDDHFLARAINLSLYPEPLKLYFTDTRPQFKKLLPHGSTSYLSFLPQCYNLELTDYESHTVLFTRESQLFKISRYYALYIIGGTRDYPLKVLCSAEGSSMFHFSD